MKELVKVMYTSPKQVHEALQRNWSEKTKVFTRLVKVKELMKELKEKDKALDVEHKELMDALMIT